MIRNPKLTNLVNFETQLKIRTYMPKPFLAIKNLAVTVEGKAVVRDFSLSVEKGSIHALMGPNGSGKSSLAYAIMGHPAYAITAGKIFFEGKEQNFTTTARLKVRTEAEEISINQKLIIALVVSVAILFSLAFFLASRLLHL